MTLIERIEAADIAVAKAAAPIERSSVGRALGKIGALGDQPPLRALGAAVVIAGLWRDEPRLAAAGVRMLVAHSLATLLKTRVKKRVDRSRPSRLIEDGQYEARPGDDDDHDMTSFPSGHTAGTTAMAAAFARAYPGHRGAAGATAATIALLQVPRRAHYVSDIAAGAAIGLLCEAAVAWLWPVPQPH